MRTVGAMSGHGWEQPAPLSRWTVALPVGLVALAGLGIWTLPAGLVIGGFGPSAADQLVAAAWSPLQGGVAGGFFLLLLAMLAVLLTGRRRGPGLRPRDLAVVLLVLLALLQVTSGAVQTYARTHLGGAEVVAARKLPALDGLTPPTAAELRPRGDSTDLDAVSWARPVAGGQQQACAIVDDLARAQIAQPARRSDLDDSCSYAMADGMVETSVESYDGTLHFTVEPYFGPSPGTGG